MPKSFTKLARIALIAFLCLSAAPQGTDAKKWDPAELKRLEWLSGTWAFEENGVVTEEHWRPLQGTTLLGTSHTYDKEKTRFFEFLRISARAGSIAYVAMPGGSPKPTLFPMVSCDEKQVVFENPEHDHPQRIRYEKTEKGVTATISMLDGTRSKAFVFERK
ncbi:MAG: hypothetical protein IPJ77_09330 [Planctomycetes bacterium]|nr:hypothetical protein [Planctomycetota bacterium]